MAIAPAAVGSVSVVITAIDGATKTIEAVQKRIAGLVSPVTDVTRSLGRMGEAIGLDRLKERLVGVGDGFRSMTEGVTKSFERLGLILLGGGGLLEGFRRIAEGAAEIGIQAKTIGLTTEALSRLQFAAQQSGVSAEQLGTALGRFSKNAVQAATTGTGNVAQAFQALHIPLLDATRHMRPLPDLLGDVAERFSHMPDGIDKTALAMFLFGRAGKELIPLLDRGKAGIADLSRAADLLGITLSTELAERLHTVSTRMDILGDIATGLSRQLVGSLAPGMIELSNTVLQFVVDNQSKIKEFFEDLGRGFSQFVKDLLNPTSQLRKHITEWAETFQWFGRKFNEFGEAIGGRWKIVAGIVGAWILGPAIAGIGALTAALIAIVPALAEVAIGIGALLLFTPVGWAIDAAIAISGLAYAIYRNWDGIKAWWHRTIEDIERDYPAVAAGWHAFETDLSAMWKRIALSFGRSWYSGVVQVLMEFDPVNLVGVAIDALVASLRASSISFREIGKLWLWGLLLPFRPHEAWDAIRGSIAVLMDELGKLDFGSIGAKWIFSLLTPWQGIGGKLGNALGGALGDAFKSAFPDGILGPQPPMPPAPALPAIMPPNAVPGAGPRFGPQRLPAPVPPRAQPSSFWQPQAPASETRRGGIDRISYTPGRLDVGALAGGVTLASFLPSQPAVVAQQTEASIGFFSWLHDAFSDFIDSLSGNSSGIGGMVPAVAPPGGAIAPPPSSIPAFVGKTFKAIENAFNLPGGILDRVWAAEFGRGKNMLSPAGALGHFQFMPGTAKRYGLSDPFDLTQSANAAGQYLGDLMHRFGGDIAKALAGYNWGEGNVDKDVAAHGADWWKFLPRETENYLQRILGGYQPTVTQERPAAVSQAPAPLVQSGTPGAAQGPATQITLHAPITINGAESPAATGRAVQLALEEQVTRAERYARSDLSD